MADRRSISVRRAAPVALMAVAISTFWAFSGWDSPARGDEERQAGPPPVRLVRRIVGVPYAAVNDEVLRLDVYSRLAEEEPAARPLINFIHGGGWMTGFRWDIPKELILFVDRGFVVASIDYRGTRGNRFLANVHDVKAAVRFLRANSDSLGIDADRVALVGFASGGHLAALAGLAGGDLEGDIGDHDDVSSAVHAIVSFQGPMNLSTILVQKTPTGTGKHRVPVELLLGGSPEKCAAHALKASPIGHVRPGSPPLLLVYGGADDQVPAAQGREMAAAYRKHNASVELVVIDEAEHKSLLKFDERRTTLLARFLSQTLPPQ